MEVNLERKDLRNIIKEKPIVKKSINIVILKFSLGYLLFSLHPTTCRSFSDFLSSCLSFTLLTAL